MDTSKIIKGVVNSGRYTVTAPIIKEDYGLYLQIEGVELPSTYEVDFSNSEHNGTSVTMIGNADGVLIPSQFISSGKDVFAFLYHVGANYGRTVYKFRIPNKCRPDRTEEEPTPEEQSVIDQAISALNTAVAQTAQDVIDADVSAQNASADAERAEEARTDAQNYATQAQTSANNASASAQASANSATASAQSATQAEQIKSDVEDLADDAQASANASEQYARASANSATQAQGYAQSASASASSAQGYASNAQSYSQTASAKAQDASGYAQTASQKATESAQSATNAQGYAQTAEQAKTDAQTAQTAAETAQGKAEDAQAAAESVAESIPSDYSQLSEDVSDLKEGLSDINSEIFIGEADTDPHGITFNSRIDTDGSFVSASSGKYCRTGRMDMSGHIAVSIEAKSGYRIKLFYYSSGDGTPASKYTGSSEGYTTSYSLNGSNLKCLAFVISRLDSGVIDTTLTADDFFTVTFYDSRLDAQEREIENINQFLGRSIKILGIGNSYTRDSLRWVWKILTKCGFENVIVGHGYWGASTLQAQYESIDPTSANHTVYEYWKYTDTQDATKTSGKSLDDIVSDEKWDVVVFQQQSDNAGQYNSFVNNDFDINDFVSYVKTNISNPNLRIGIAQTWSHATGYHSTNFDNWYNGDPATQLLAIETVIPQVANHMTQCDMIVKTGEAVKYGRLNQYLGTIGNEMLRSDKNHLDYGIPSFMAGMVYAMTICGIKPCDISWYPTGTDEGQSGITATTFLSYLAKQCALQATMQI